MDYPNSITPRKSYTQAWSAIQKYCAYQERCHKETRNRLYDYGLRKDDVEELLYRLIENNYVNEERFAVAYAGGKFRVKKWGRNKIKAELKRRDISDYCIRKAMLEIEDEAYLEVLHQVIELKSKVYKASNHYELNSKIANYCYTRGFENDLIWDILRARMSS